MAHFHPSIQTDLFCFEMLKSIVLNADDLNYCCLRSLGIILMLTGNGVNLEAISRQIPLVK